MSKLCSAWGAVALAAGALAWSSASAHTIVIDTSGAWTEIPTSGGLNCTPCAETLDFNINAGSGLTNQVYVYDDGLISIGSPFGAEPVLDPSNLAGDPTNPSFLSVLYDTDPTFTPSLIKYVFFTGTEDDITFEVPDAYGNSVPFDGFGTFAQVQITPDSGGNPGAFTATWAYGYPNPIATPADSYLGYPLNGYQFGSDYNYGYADQDSASFNYAPSVSPAPEPMTWIELVIGLGLAGGALRMRTRRFARA